MERPLRHALMGLLMLGGSLLAFAPRAQELPPLDIVRLMPDLKLKVVRLTAIAPDGRRAVLVEAPQGVILPLDDFSGLQAHLDADRLQGGVAYHSLQAELVPALYAIDVEGNPVELALQRTPPTRIPLMGAVLKLDEGVRLLGVRPEAPAAPAGPERGCFRRAHDD